MSGTPHNDLNLAQDLQFKPLNLFYQPSNDDNFYHITCEIILKEFQLGNSNSLDDDNYDYEFFFNYHHIKCKLIPHNLVVNILNKEIYDRNFDGSELKRKYFLTSYQKLNLETNLKQVLPFYLYIPEGSVSDENTTFFHENTESNMTQLASIVDNQSYFDNDMLDNAATTTEMAPAALTAAEFHKDTNDDTYQVTPQ
ncbi:hypothetical protein C1645_802248 [Glomus cerebriforme]|uniref:Uncharacterized protein n=1 Tax=Glomus cerebriforme TaxID=658196 RepID=A0A397TH72_9GLOM|nr:hypothetical protein C1645_802248 [Glomus cerebriforme]